MVFRGTLQQIKDAFAHIPGSWVNNGGSHRFKANSGAHADWWPSTGTIRIQGAVEGMPELKDAATKLTETTPAAIVQPDNIVSLRNNSEYLFALDSNGVAWMMLIGTLVWTPLNK